MPSFLRMTQREPPIIDMMPDGSFAQARPTPRGFSFQLNGLAALGVAAAFTIALVVFFVWLLMWLVPIVAGVALLGYGARRLRRWWIGKSAAPPSVHGVWNQGRR